MSWLLLPPTSESLSLARPVLRAWGSPGEGAQWIFIANAPELS